jgi:hypothetical protein
VLGSLLGIDKVIGAPDLLGSRLGATLGASERVDSEDGLSLRGVPVGENDPDGVGCSDVRLGETLGPVLGTEDSLGSADGFSFGCADGL